MTNTPLAARRAHFRALHQSGCFLLPNPWDVGGAKRLEAMGFEAIATSSAASAMTIGKKDYELTVDDAIAHLEVLCGGSKLPVNADFENGFSDDPAQVAANVTRAIAAGTAGLSIEDRSGAGLRELDHAVACVQAAREAIDASGEDVILVARTEGYLANLPDPDIAIERLKAFSDAGADCLYAPGITDLSTIERMVKAVAPKPLNVLMWGSAFTPAQLAAIGVRRISLGGALAGASWAAFDQAARAFLDAA